MLNDLEILQSKIITPFNMDNLQPHSYDATLDSCIKIAKYNEETDTPSWEAIFCETDSVVLQPRAFALAATVEYLNLPQDVVGFVQGKSSIGRNGLQIENAGLIDAGFEGTITLELYNMAPWPIKLKAGMPICQLHFTKVDSPIYKNYRKTGHYNKQLKAQEAYYTL